MIIIIIIIILASIKNKVDALIQLLEDNLEKHEGGLITTTRRDTDWQLEVQQNDKKKLLYGPFKRLISNISFETT